MGERASVACVGGTFGGYLGVMKKVVSGLSRELWPGKFAGQASAQCSVLQPLVCHVPPVLGGLTFVSLVSLVSTPFALTVGQSVSQSVGGRLDV